MFEVIQYLLNNNINSIRSDCAEYKILQQKYKSLKAQKKAAYAKLKEFGACVSNYKTCQKYDLVIDNGCPPVIENVVVEAYTETLHACDNWSETPCLNENCPHFAENKNYIRISQDYKKVCDMKKRFWCEKFNRTK